MKILVILVVTVVVVTGKNNRNFDIGFQDFHKSDLHPFSKNLQYFQRVLPQHRRPFRSYFLRDDTPSFNTRRSPWKQVPSFAYEKPYFAEPPPSIINEQIIAEEPPLSLRSKPSIDEFPSSWGPPAVTHDIPPTFYGEPPAIPDQKVPEIGPSLPYPKPALPFRGPWDNLQKHLSFESQLPSPESSNDLNLGNNGAGLAWHSPAQISNGINPWASGNPISMADIPSVTDIPNIQAIELPSTSTIPSPPPPPPPPPPLLKNSYGLPLLNTAPWVTASPELRTKEAPMTGYSLDLKPKVVSKLLVLIPDVPRETFTGNPSMMETLPDSYGPPKTMTNAENPPQESKSNFFFQQSKQPETFSYVSLQHHQITAPLKSISPNFSISIPSAPSSQPETINIPVRLPKLTFVNSEPVQSPSTSHPVTQSPEQQNTRQNGYQPIQPYRPSVMQILQQDVNTNIQQTGCPLKHPPPPYGFQQQLGGFGGIDYSAQQNNPVPRPAVLWIGKEGLNLPEQFRPPVSTSPEFEYGPRLW